MSRPTLATSCCFEGCDRTGKMTRGLCRLHYQRLQLHGDPAVTNRPTLHLTPEERLWARVLLGSPDECWLWTGNVTKWGYGRIQTSPPPEQFMTYVHRLAYELLVGPIPAGLHLDHLCHTDDLSCPPSVCMHRRCCNPAHLEPVTQSENGRRQHRVAA